MAWTNTKWACGHSGKMQLYGKIVARDSRVAYEAGRQCMVCWLLAQWKKKNDPRAKSPDAVALAVKVAEGKGIRLDPEQFEESNNPLAGFSTEEVLAEIKRRGKK